MNKYFIFIFCFLLSPSFVFSDQGESHRADSHAPIGVMRDHVHKEGEFMLSYRYMYMFMDDNRTGSSKVSDASVLENYMVSPTKMRMKMHMIGAMYGISDKLTFSAMSGYLTNEMDHIRRDGTTFLQDSEDLTDTSLNLLYQIYNTGEHRVQFNAGLSLPTGSINEPSSSGNGHLAYAMTTGSGTYDFLPGVSYSGFSENWSWGSQLNGVIRLEDNSNDYRFGNRFEFTNWLARKLDESLSLSLRLNYLNWGNIKGRDKSLMMPFMAPPMDYSLYSGEKIQGLVGFNYLFTSGFFSGHRLAVEFGIPLYQDIDGPRLAEESQVILGWQKAF